MITFVFVRFGLVLCILVDIGLVGLGSVRLG